MKQSKLLSILLSISMGMALLTGAIAIPILCRPFYYAHIGPLELEEHTGLNETQIRTAYDEVLDYCLGGEAFSSGVLSCSKSGQDHFADVRRLFLLDLWAFGLSVAALAGLLIYAKAAKRTWALLLGRGPAFWVGAGCGGVFLLMGALAALNFEQAFVLFHRVFFPGKDNWIFDPQVDQIIHILPQEFFRNCAILVFALLVTVGTVMIVWDIVRKKK